jgi:hypothetical protein
MWSYGDPAVGTQLSPMIGMAHGLIQPTAVALPQVVGRTHINAEYEDYGNFVCLTMVNENGNAVSVPDPSVAVWRLRVALRGYVV